MFGGLGIGEVVMILLVLLLVFGARRLPELGGALGKGIREFKRSVHEIEGELTRPDKDSPPREVSSESEKRTAVTSGEENRQSVDTRAGQEAPAPEKRDED